MTGLDPRLNAFRPDLADLGLKGRVEAERFVEGRAMRVAAPQAPLRRAPLSDAHLQTEALRGESVFVFETSAEGWCWAQLAEDRYVGWIKRDALSEPASEPTHRVSALRTFVFPKPDIKAPPLAALPFGARVTKVGEAEDKNARYALIEPEGAIVIQHLSPLASFEADFTTIAEHFLGTPYLWGGRTGLGIDCSGLVQIALGACGISAPRDSDMQEHGVGAPLLLAGGFPPLKRGDLVFWPGHVGIMRDDVTLLHANSHHMAVANEPFEAAATRFRQHGLEIASVRRVLAPIALADYEAR